MGSIMDRRADLAQAFIEGYYDSLGHGPTIPEIAAGVTDAEGAGRRISTHVVKRLLMTLEARGDITPLPTTMARTSRVRVRPALSRIDRILIGLAKTGMYNVSCSPAESGWSVYGFWRGEGPMDNIAYGGAGTTVELAVEDLVNNYYRLRPTPDL